MLYHAMIRGAEIGVVAFFALIVFALCCGVVLVVLLLLVRIFGGKNEQ